MKIQRADLAARRRAIICLGLTLIVCVIGLVFVEQNKVLVDAWIERTAQNLIALPHLFPIVSFLMITPVLLFAVYLFVEGKRICNAQRFPVPGQVVIRDTKVREGKSAILHGRVIQVFALTLFACALMLSILITKFVYSFISD